MYKSDSHLWNKFYYYI